MIRAIARFLPLLIAVGLASPASSQTVGIVAPPTAEDVAVLVEVELSAAGFSLVDRREVAAIVEERRMAWTGLSAADVRGLGVIRGAEALLWLEPEQDGVHRYRLIDVRRGIVLRAGARPGTADETAAAFFVGSLLPSLRAISAVQDGSRLVALAPIRVVGGSPEGLDLAARARRYLVEELSRHRGLLVLERENFDEVRIERAASDEASSLLAGEVLLEGTLEGAGAGRWTLRIGTMDAGGGVAPVEAMIDVLRPAEALRDAASRITVQLHSAGSTGPGLVEEGTALAERVRWLIRAGLHREASEALDLLETLRPEDRDVMLLRFEAGNKLLMELQDSANPRECAAYAIRHFHFVRHRLEVIREGLEPNTSWFRFAVDALEKADLFGSHMSVSDALTGRHAPTSDILASLRTSALALGEALWRNRPSEGEAESTAKLLRLARRFALIFSRDRREFVPALEGILASDDRIRAIHSLMFVAGEEDVTAARGRAGEPASVAMRREAVRLAFATTSETIDDSLARFHALAWEAREWIIGDPSFIRWPEVIPGSEGNPGGARPGGSQGRILPEPELFTWMQMRRDLRQYREAALESALRTPKGRQRMLAALEQARGEATPEQMRNLAPIARALGVEMGMETDENVIRARLHWQASDHLREAEERATPFASEKATYLPGSLFFAMSHSLLRVDLPSLATTRFRTPRQFFILPEAVHVDRRHAFVFGSFQDKRQGVFRLEFASGTWTYGAAPEGLPLRNELGERDYLPGTDNLLFIPRRVSNSDSDVACGIQMLDKRTLESTWLVHGLRRPPVTPMDLPGNLFDVILTEDPSRIIVKASRVGSGPRADAHEVRLDTGEWRRLNDAESRALGNRPRIWEYPVKLTSDDARVGPPESSIDFAQGSRESGPRITVRSGTTTRTLAVLLEAQSDNAKPTAGSSRPDGDGMGYDNERTRQRLLGMVGKGLFVPEGLVVMVPGGFHFIPRADLTAALAAQGSDPAP